MNDEIKKLIGLAPPPQHIFKFNLPVTQSRDQTTWNVQSQGGWYFPHHAEYIPGKGCFEYFREYDGHPAPALPAIRVPFWDTIQLLAPIKRQLSMALKFIGSHEMRMLVICTLFLGKRWRERLLNKMFEVFNEIADANLHWKYLDDGYYSPPVKEIIGFTERLLVNLGIKKETAYWTAQNVGMMFENDQAYCWRFQDAMTEANEENLKKDPYGEAKKLVEVLLQRDPNPEGLRGKYDYVLKALQYALYIPSIRKAVKNALKYMNVENCKLTENDIYHTIMYGSYNIQGRTMPERMKLYEQYHGADQTKWPARWQLG